MRKAGLEKYVSVAGLVREDRVAWSGALLLICSLLKPLHRDAAASVHVRKDVNPTLWIWHRSPVFFCGIETKTDRNFLSDQNCYLPC